MPCDTLSRTEIERRARMESLKALERGLKARAMKIVTSMGQVRIEGWANRGDWKDACVLRQLLHSEDFELRRMVNDAIPREMQVKMFGHSH